MNDLYAITDLRGYAQEMRESAASSICNEYIEDLDTYISIEQMIGLVMEECNGFDSNNRPLVTSISNEKIYENTMRWIYNVGLAKLAAKGNIECAWDDESNSMIFWPNKNTEKSK